MKKAILVILPILFTAQSCNFLFGNLYGDQGTGSQGVFVSTDSGDTWAATNQGVKNKSLLSAVSIQKIAIEPGISEDVVVASKDNGVYASSDRGKTWGQILPNFSAYDILFNPRNTQEIYAGGALGNAGAILKSMDHGTTWVQVYSEPSTTNTAIVNLCLDPTDPKIVYAASSSGSVLKSPDSGITWIASSSLKDRPTGLVVAGDSTRTIYAAGRTTGLFKSTDSGKTWQPLASIPQTGTAQYETLFFDYFHSTGLYVGTRTGLFRTMDGGAHWTQLYLPANSGVSDVTAVTVNPENTRQVYVAIRYVVYRSDDSGVSWKTISLPTKQVIDTLVVDPAEPNRVYAGIK
ncbi:hypothetical protein D4R52_02605 [bacterium]|nr:MAG: hypothetical protein D4R52_02605 [bacterium]